MNRDGIITSVIFATTTFALTMEVELCVMIATAMRLMQLSGNNHINNNKHNPSYII